MVYCQVAGNGLPLRMRRNMEKTQQQSKLTFSRLKHEKVNDENKYLDLIMLYAMTL